VTAVCEDEDLAILSLRGKPGSSLVVAICVNGIKRTAFIDTGAAYNHISVEYCRHAKLKTYENNECIDLAVKGSKVKSHGSCCVTVEAFDRRYDDVTFSVLDGLLWDVILGREFMELHKSVNIHFGGQERPSHLGTLKPLKASVHVELFERMSPEIRLIAVKSRQ